MSDGGELRIVGLDGLPEVHPGDDLGALVAEAIERAGTGLREDDVLVVTHKIVSKAEDGSSGCRRSPPRRWRRRGRSGGGRTRGRSR